MGAMKLSMANDGVGEGSHEGGTTYLNAWTDVPASLNVKNSGDSLPHQCSHCDEGSSPSIIKTGFNI